jgi:multiple sugar transport system permease protein
VSGPGKLTRGKEASPPKAVLASLRPRRGRRRTLTAADRRFGLLLAAPATAAVLVLIGWPAVQTVIYSFQKVNLNGADEFVGFRNFSTLFSSGEFHTSLRVTVEYALGFLLVSTLLGLLFALLLNERFPGRGIARTLLIIPWASPWIIVGIMWKWFLDADVGALNGLLYQADAIGEYRAFLLNENEALASVIVAAAWRQASLSGLLFLAALQTIPHELS